MKAQIYEKTRKRELTEFENELLKGVLSKRKLPKAKAKTKKRKNRKGSISYSEVHL
jgi:hypothetical protein